MDQSDWCLMFLCSQARISLLQLPEPRAKRKTIFKVRCFKGTSLRASEELFVNWFKTKERFQGGMSLQPSDLSLWKLSTRLVRFSSLLTILGEFSSLYAMADL